MLVFNEDSPEKGGTGTEDIFMCLKLEAIWGDQGDISELLVSPDLPQIGEGVFLEILSGQKHFSYVNHHLLNSGTSAEWVSPFEHIIYNRGAPFFPFCNFQLKISSSRNT